MGEDNYRTFSIWFKWSIQVGWDLKGPWKKTNDKNRSFLKRNDGFVHFSLFSRLYITDDCCPVVGLPTFQPAAASTVWTLTRRTETFQTLVIYNYSGNHFCFHCYICWFMTQLKVQIDLRSVLLLYREEVKPRSAWKEWKTFKNLKQYGIPGGGI